MTQSTGQVSRDAAEVYSALFVPALFRPFAPRVAELARIAPGDAVLDVACGTGVLSAQAPEAGAGRTVGLDRNAGMLAVARRRVSEVEWCEGRAEELPFADRTFDVVMSQFGLMFFDDRARSLAEMWRVLRPGGRLVVAVWAELKEVPGYAKMCALLERLFGKEIADEIRAPYAWGAVALLERLSADAGIDDASVVTVEGSVGFASIDAWVHTDIRGWTLSTRIDDAQYEALLEAARQEMAEFLDDAGAVRFASPIRVIRAQRALV